MQKGTLQTHLFVSSSLPQQKKDVKNLVQKQELQSSFHYAA